MPLICLNVGGVHYWTDRSTLEASNSFFSALALAPEAEVFIDRDPTYFRHVLNWLRGVRFLPEDEMQLRELAYEADFYSMEDMCAAIQSTRRRFSFLQNVSEISASLAAQ
jgi:hypothetical protein